MSDAKLNTDLKLGAVVLDVNLHSEQETQDIWGGPPPGMVINKMVTLQRMLCTVRVVSPEGQLITTEFECFPVQIKTEPMELEHIQMLRQIKDDITNVFHIQ